MWPLISPTIVWRAELRCWFYLDGGRWARNYLVCRRAVRSQIVSQFISKSSRQDSVSHPTRKWCGRYIQPRPVGRWSWQPAKELVQQPTNCLGLLSLAFLMGPDWLQSVLVGTFLAWSSRPIKFGLVDWLDEDVGAVFMKSPLRHLQQPRLWLARLPRLLRSTCLSLWRRRHFCDSDFGPETPLMERWGRFC